MNQFFSLGLLLHYWLLYQSANDNWLDFAFLNNAITIFCLKYSLNNSHSTQNASFVPVEHSTSISWKFTFWWNFTFIDFTTIVMGVRNTNIVFFIISKPSTQIQLTISGLLIVVGKPVRNTYLISWHTETWLDIDCLLESQYEESLFYLHAAIFEIPKQCFIIKSLACWGIDVSIEIYKLAPV